MSIFKPSSDDFFQAPKPTSAQLTHEFVAFSARVEAGSHPEAHVNAVAVDRLIGAKLQGQIDAGVIAAVGKPLAL